MTDFPQIECKKHAYRQTQDGVVISFVVHPNDITPELASAPLGTRYAAVLLELTDDEMVRTPPKPKSLAQQAGILCGEITFLKFLEENYQHLVTGPISNDFDAASMVRQICGVESRADFDSDPAAGQRWRSLKGQFEAWKTL
jgi:hypothetical protein